MNEEEKMEKLMFMQKYFNKSFWLSFILLLIASATCIFAHDAQVAFVNKYLPITAEDFNYIVLLVLGIWKVLIIQFTLIPAIVIWCIRRCCKNKNKDYRETM